MRLAVSSIELALWKTRNFVFFVGVIAMNYTLSRPSPVDFVFLTALFLCLVVNQAIRLNFVVLFILLTFWALSFFNASIPYLGEENVVYELVAKSFVLTIAALACYISTTWNARSYETFLKVYIASCVIASLLGIGGFLLGIDLLTWDGRARGLIDDPNMYGSFLIPAILACVYFLDRRIGRRSLVVGALSILAVGIILSFSRVAIAALLVCLTAYVIFLNRFRLHKTIPLMIAIFVVGVVAVFVAYLASEAFAAKLLERLSVAMPYDLGREGRYGRYLLAIPMILDNPMGFGVLQLEKIFPEPIHNIFLSSFINYGWSGGFTWLVLFIASMFVAIDNYRRTRNPLAVLLLFSFLGIVLCASLHEGEHWRQLWLWLGLLWGFSVPNFAPARRHAATPRAA